MLVSVVERAARVHYDVSRFAQLKDPLPGGCAEDAYVDRGGQEIFVSREAIPFLAFQFHTRLLWRTDFSAHRLHRELEDRHRVDELRFPLRFGHAPIDGVMVIGIPLVGFGRVIRIGRNGVKFCFDL